MTTALLLLESLRPTQWIKNAFILIPLLFAKRVFYYQSLLQSLAALAIFCLLTGAVYLINDIIDLEADREHPQKKLRPLAARRISIRLAKITSAILLLISLLWGAYLGRNFFLVLVIYLAIQVLYNCRLKNVVILDIFCISAGFFIRVVAGAVAIQVMISHWLIVCAILISMFLALAKRRHELVFLGEVKAKTHRKILAEYSTSLLDQMIGVITASTLLSYMLYCTSTVTIQKFGTDRLIYTFPFVLYGIFRYLYLIHKKNRGGTPEKVLVSDIPLMLDVLLWALLCMLIVYGVI